jgi:hypothetical protein
MALTATQIVAAINGSITTVYPDVEPAQQETLFRNNLVMLLLQGKQILAQAEAAIVRNEAQAVAQQAEVEAQAAMQAANAAQAEFLAFVAGLAEQP